MIKYLQRKMWNTLCSKNPYRVGIETVRARNRKCIVGDIVRIDYFKVPIWYTFVLSYCIRKFKL